LCGEIVDAPPIILPFIEQTTCQLSDTNSLHLQDGAVTEQQYSGINGPEFVRVKAVDLTDEDV
jgi:hypothetical protein